MATVRNFFLILFLLLFPINAFAALAVGYTTATDTMLITGGTSGTPVTWADVWDYDTGGGGETGGTGQTDGPNSVDLNTIMTEVIEDGVYLINCLVFIGESGTTTYLASEHEMIWFTDTHWFFVKPDATFRLGEESGDYGINGSRVSLDAELSRNVVDGGTLLMYDSRLNQRRGSINNQFNTGNVTLIQSILGGRSTSAAYYFNAGLSSVIIRNLYTSNIFPVFFLSADTLDGYHGHKGDAGLYARASITAKNANITNDGSGGGVRTHSGSTNAVFIDPVALLSKTIFSAGDFIREQYTTNIHVTDNAGDNVATATVTCNDTDGTLIFDVNTDANGDIAEQTVEYKNWTTTAETETDYSPHTFVISKAGYRTQTIIYNFSDGKVNWEVELDDGDTVIYDSTIYDSTLY